MLVKIPVRSHLLKFLKYKIGSDRLEIKHYSQLELFEEKGNIIYLQRELSKTLYPFINTKKHWEESELCSRYKYSIIGLELKNYLINQKRLSISTVGVIKFNEKIEDMFYEELISRLDIAISNHKRHDEVIFEFMAACLIDEDDIRFDSLKKRCWRMRTKFKEQIFLHNNLARTGAVLDLSFTDKYVQS
jgi:hypothetical protein